MITGKDLNTEIKLLDLISDPEKGSKDEAALLRAVVKGIALLLKVVRGIRTNQVQALRKAGVELVKPKGRTTEKKEETN